MQPGADAAVGGDLGPGQPAARCEPAGCGGGHPDLALRRGQPEPSVSWEFEGTVTEQIAWFTEHELVARADLVVGLYSGGSSLHYLRSALMMEDDADFDRQGRLMAALRAFAASISYIGYAQSEQGTARTTAGAARLKY